MKGIVITSFGFPTEVALSPLGDFMARLRDPDKAIVYLNQVVEHIDMEQDRDTNWVHSMLDEVNSI